MGVWPWCPHEIVANESNRHFRWENRTMDNLEDNPVEVTSMRHLESVMRRNHLVERPREHIADLNHRRYQKGLPPIKE